MGCGVAEVDVGKIHVDDDGMNVSHEVGVTIMSGNNPMTYADDVRVNEVQTSSGRAVGFVIASFVSSGDITFYYILVCRVAFDLVKSNARRTFGTQEGVQ